VTIAWDLGQAVLQSGTVLYVEPGSDLVLDSASPLYTFLNGQGALRAYVQGTDDVSRAAISN
jgi:hypothetical protein